MPNILHELHNLEGKDIPLVFWDDFNRGNPPNWHKNIEILYCVSGNGKLICSGIEQDMIPGHIYCLNAGEIHAMTNLGVLHYYCLILDYNFLAQNKLVFDDLLLRTDVHSEEASKLFLEVVRRIQRPDRFSSAYIRGALVSLMAMLYQNHSVPHAKYILQTSPDIHSAVKAAVKYIDAHYSQRLTLDDIAKSSGFSKYHFARQFKQATGMTVVSYINLIRCQHAKALLGKKSIPIQQVAGLCGYDSASYFTRVFQKTEGILPSEYLKQLEK